MLTRRQPFESTNSGIGVATLASLLKASIYCAMQNVSNMSTANEVRQRILVLADEADC